VGELHAVHVQVGRGGRAGLELAEHQQKHADQEADRDEENDHHDFRRDGVVSGTATATIGYRRGGAYSSKTTQLKAFPVLEPIRILKARKSGVQRPEMRRKKNLNEDVRQILLQKVTYGVKSAWDTTDQDENVYMNTQLNNKMTIGGADTMSSVY